jgi:hypothetical protein
VVLHSAEPMRARAFDSMDECGFGSEKVSAITSMKALLERNRRKPD